MGQKGNKHSLNHMYFLLQTHTHTVGKRSVTTVGADFDNKFLKETTDVQLRLKLTWNTNTRLWVDQWPLGGEWLQQAQKMVKEQFDLGNIVPSTSLWNTPMFVIPKQTGKWRLS